MQIMTMITTTGGTFLVDVKYFITKRLLPSIAHLIAKYGDLPFLLHGRELLENVSEKSLDTYFWWKHMCISLMSYWGVYMFINWVMIWSMSYYWVVHVCLTHVLPGYTCMSYWCFTGLYYTSSWAVQVHVLLNIVGFKCWLLTLHVVTQIFNNLCLSLLFLLKLLLQLFFHFGLFVLFLRYLSCMW